MRDAAAGRSEGPAAGPDRHDCEGEDVLQRLAVRAPQEPARELEAEGQRSVHGRDPVRRPVEPVPGVRVQPAAEVPESLARDRQGDRHRRGAGEPDEGSPGLPVARAAGRRPDHRAAGLRAGVPARGQGRTEAGCRDDRVHQPPLRRGRGERRAERVHVVGSGAREPAQAEERPGELPRRPRHPRDGGRPVDVGGLQQPPRGLPEREARGRDRRELRAAGRPRRGAAVPRDLSGLDRRRLPHGGHGPVDHRSVPAGRAPRPVGDRDGGAEGRPRLLVGQREQGLLDHRLRRRADRHHEPHGAGHAPDARRPGPEGVGHPLAAAADHAGELQAVREGPAGR